MKYLLITKRGTVMCFYVKSVAEMYLTIHGGVLYNDKGESDEARRDARQDVAYCG